MGIGVPNGFHPVFGEGLAVNYYVYLLRCSDNTIYTGCTNNLERRVQTHNAGKGAKYTRSRRPVELVYQEIQPDRSAALRREAEVKRLSRKDKLALIAAENN